MKIVSVTSVLVEKDFLYIPYTLNKATEYCKIKKRRIVLQNVYIH